jgi:transcriptional regulator with XRE-family HTH domain
MTDTLNEDPTAGANLPALSDLGVPRTKTIEELANDITEQAGYLRNRTVAVSHDVADVHHRSLKFQLDTRIARLVTQDPVALLEELAEMGFGWRDIARMVGVSVPALRRWRNGEMPTGENRRAIAQLLAFIQIIRDDHLVFGPASWMEVPIADGTPLTGIDLYTAGHWELVFDLATLNCTPEEALDHAEPNWRERYHSDWEVGTAADGQPYIRSKPGR